MSKLTDSYSLATDPFISCRSPSSAFHDMLPQVRDMPQAVRDHVGTLLLKLTLRELFDWHFMQVGDISLECHKFQGLLVPMGPECLSLCSYWMGLALVLCQIMHTVGALHCLGLAPPYPKQKGCNGWAVDTWPHTWTRGTMVFVEVLLQWGLS